MKKFASLLLAVVLCASLLSIGVSAAPEVELEGYTKVIDFSGFEVGYTPGLLDTDVAETPMEGVMYGKYGWDDGIGKFVDVLFAPRIVEYGGGKALEWSNLVDGNTHTLYINTAPDGLDTDASGATGLVLWVDASQHSNQAEIELRVVERSGDNGLQAWCSWKDDAGTTLSEYFIWNNNKWVRAETTWGRVKLPQGYKGWVKIAMDIKSLTLPWWTSPLKGAEGDTTLDLDDVFAVGIRIQSKNGDKVIVDEIGFVDDTATTAATTTTKPTTTTTKKPTTTGSKADANVTTVGGDDATQPSTEEDNGGNTAMIIIIVVAAVVVLGGAAAAFVILKKKKG